MPQRPDQGGIFDTLDWGEVYHEDLKLFKRYEVERSGNRLFLIRNGDAVFPKSDVLTKPLQQKYTAWGFVNTNSIRFDVGVKRPLTSLDSIKFNIILHLTVKLPDSMAALTAIAKRHEDLEQRIRHSAEVALDQTLSQFSYRQIFLSDSHVQEKVVIEVRSEISKSTPYSVEVCSFSAEAEDDSIDNAIRDAAGATVSEEERQRIEAIVESEIKREREQRQTQLDEQIALAKKQADAERDARAADAKSRMDIESEAADKELQRINEAEKQKLELLKEKMTLSKDDPLAVIAAENPDLYIKLMMEKAKLTAQVEIARAIIYFTSRPGATTCQRDRPALFWWIERL